MNDNYLDYLVRMGIIKSYTFEKVGTPGYDVGERLILNFKDNHSISIKSSTESINVETELIISEGVGDEE